MPTLPLLTSNFKRNLFKRKGKTPLHEAAQIGHVEITRLLISAGAQVNAREK